MSALADWLLTLQSLTIYAVFMAAAAVLAGTACIVLARIAQPPATKEHLDVTMRTTGAVMAALTLILAFCAVQARGIAADARATVTAEVTAIGSLARIADRLGAPGQALRHDLVAYLRSIADDEFPHMAAAGRDARTQALAIAVENAAYLAAGGANGSLATDVLEEADDIESARDRRLHAARAGLPQELWVLIALLVGLLAVTGALYPPKPHTVAMLAIQAAGCGALIAFVFIMDQPFRGSVRITAEPYVALLHSIEHRSAMACGACFGME